MAHCSINALGGIGMRFAVIGDLFQTTRGWYEHETARMVLSPSQYILVFTCIPLRFIRKLKD